MSSARENLQGWCESAGHRIMAQKMLEAALSRCVAREDSWCPSSVWSRGLASLVQKSSHRHQVGETVMEMTTMTMLATMSTAMKTAGWGCAEQRGRKWDGTECLQERTTRAMTPTGTSNQRIDVRRKSTRSNRKCSSLFQPLRNFFDSLFVHRNQERLGNCRLDRWRFWKHRVGFYAEEESRTHCIG